MQIVRFLKGAAPFNAGETAGVPSADAERLIRGGYAELHRPETLTKVEPPPEVTKVDPPAASVSEGQSPPLPKGNRRPATEKP